MAAPAVSVVIPTYNRANLVPRAVQSALAGAAPEDEIIVADDGSTDRTGDALAIFGDRIRYAKLSHAGCGATRNRGIALATKPLIAFLDSDDEWDADKLELQRSLMSRRPDILFCFSDFRGRRVNGETMHRFLVQWHRDSRSWDEILSPGVSYSSVAGLPPGRNDFQVHIGDMFLAEMESDYVATSTVMVRRVEAGDALHFAEDIKISEDKQCFGRLAQRGPGAYLDCETSVQWGHLGPRVSDADIYALASARIILLERIWAEDPAFVARYGDRLKQALRTQHLKRARWLLVRGRMSEARADLRAAGRCPLTYRMLATLPGPLARGFLNMRRMMRREVAVPFV